MEIFISGAINILKSFNTAHHMIILGITDIDHGKKLMDLSQSVYVGGRLPQHKIYRYLDLDVESFVRPIPRPMYMTPPIFLTLDCGYSTPTTTYVSTRIPSHHLVWIHPYKIKQHIHSHHPLWINPTTTYPQPSPTMD